jgi:putative transposase
VRTFKAAAARQIRLDGLPEFAWQRNYYEHVIRNDQTLAKIRDYIVHNPQLWEKDQLHPDNPSRW